MPELKNEPAPPPDAGRPDAANLSDPVFVTELRHRMVRFATLQLSDPNLAEDAVQDALIGALRNARSFTGRAAYRTWVFAILRHKIADVLRDRQRSASTQVALEPAPEARDETAFFDDSGHWRPEAQPGAWGDPEESLREAQFWRVFEACLDHLPGQQARLFMMREFVELETGEICATAGITLTNLNVTLHRARLRLRRCLEHRWFAPGADTC